MKDYKVKKIKLSIRNRKDKKQTFILESYCLSKKLEEIKVYLLKNIDNFIEINWGKFSKDFIIKHIIQADYIRILRDNDNIIAFATASNKKIININILYLEFTTVHNEYRGYNISTILNAGIIINKLISGLLKRGLKPLHVVTISRNMKIIGSLSKFAEFIYPNPELLDENGRIPPAPEETWKVSKEILKQSWDPNRILKREGNVLVGSYNNSPWLIISDDSYYRHDIKKLAETYLDYKKGADKEFIIHAKFGISSFIKYLIWVITKQ